MKRKILVVDDEPKMVEVICDYITAANYIAIKAYSGIDALKLFEAEKPDLVVLDLMLPGLSGEAVCQQIRHISKVPIIMLTAKVTENDRVAGLNMGADDYMIKPFSAKELVARINAIFRRMDAPIVEQLVFDEGQLVIHLPSRSIQINGHPVSLTPNEYKLLLTLAKRPAKVFTREELVAIVFREDFDGFDRAVDSHIKNIRKKMKQHSSSHYIRTVHGVGYQFEEEKGSATH